MNSRPERGDEPAEGDEGAKGDAYKQLAIVERYERFVDYLYPVLQNCPRRHGIARDCVLRAMFAQVELFINAGKSRQVSRLYSADANLALLRFWLRFLAAPSRKIITPNQHRVAASHLAEVGKMLGAWIGSKKRGG